MITRRALVGIGATAGGLMLSGCSKIAATPAARAFFEGTENLTRDFSRLTASRGSLAREFADSDISSTFRANGTRLPANADYAALAAGNFRDYRLVVDGLVRRPLSLSMEQIHRLPRRTQTTRHDCVEGWSAIGKWTGTPLAGLLQTAGLLPSTRYIVLHCADDYAAGKYYESIDLIDAFQPQTILAWGLNGKVLPIANGAPLRLRVERQIGYKHAKYVMRIEAVDSLAQIGSGKGGTWEDSNDYAWYAGI